jgi:hypothetical protein
MLYLKNQEGPFSIFYIGSCLSSEILLGNVWPEKKTKMIPLWTRVDFVASAREYFTHSIEISLIFQRV